MSFGRQSRNWRARICGHGKRIGLGYFGTPAEQATAKALPPGSSAATAQRSTSRQRKTGPETIIVTRAELQREAMRAVSA